MGMPGRWQGTAAQHAAFICSILRLRRTNRDRPESKEQSGRGAGGCETETGGRVIEFDPPVEEWLWEVGETPLPPYIHEPLADRGALSDRL